MVTTGLHVHDGTSWPLSSYTLQILLLLSSLPSTNRYDRPFRARRSIEGLCSITLKLLGIWVLGLLSDNHDKPVGRTVVAITVHHELRNPTLRSDFPIFLPQLHYDSKYGPSRERWTFRRSVGGNFSAFFAQKLPRSSLDRFPPNKEKLT